MESSFAKTLSEFCADLRGTFPEQLRAIDRLSMVTPDMFWQMWRGSLSLLVECDDVALFRDRRGLLAGAVRLTPTVWTELSSSSRSALWCHLRTLTLEAALAQDSLEPDVVNTLTTLVGMLGGGGGGHAASASASAPASASASSMDMPTDETGMLSFFMEKLKGFMDLSGLMGAFADMSGSGSGSGSGFESGFADMSSEADFMAGFPAIPEHLQTGTLATLIKDLMTQINPADFGLDPALFAGSDMKTLLARILEVSKEDPAKLMDGAKRMAEKIKTRISGGSINREVIIAELKEFYTLFKDHPLCKEAFEKMEEMGLGSILKGFGTTTSAPSDRLRTAQERLRRKMAARQGGPQKK